MKIVVTGATGFIGKALCDELAQTHRVIALTQSPEKAAAFFHRPLEIVKWNPTVMDGWQKSLEGSDAIVNLAGTNVASGRWSQQVKGRILNSRIKASKALIEGIKTLKEKPKSMITASAIGFYGNRGDQRLTEQSGGGVGFLAEVSQKVEECAQEIEALGIRSVLIRTGLVLGSSGGALPKMALPFKFYLGGWWGKGDQWVSWISLADETAAIQFLMENHHLSGAFNLTAPEPIQNRQFFHILAAVLKKPCWLPLPALVLKTLLGQMAEELFLSSQRVSPNRLIEAGFEFKHPELTKALEAVKNVTFV